MQFVMIQVYNYTMSIECIDINIKFGIWCHSTPVGLGIWGIGMHGIHPLLMCLGRIFRCVVLWEFGCVFNV